ncbi:MAG: ABC transporter substrate-binding protein [Ktedonobacterales bacterium]
MGGLLSQHTRRVCITLLSLLVLTATACDQPTQSNALPEAQQLLRVADFNFANNLYVLDPARDRMTITYSTFAEQAVVLLYTRLTDLDATQHPTLSAASAVKVSPDGLTYTFTLRPHLRFGDGTAITSSDVAFSLNRVLSPCSISLPSDYQPYGGQMRHVRSRSPLAWILLAIKDSVTFNAEQCNPGSTILPATGQRAPLITTLIGDSIRTPDSTTLVIALEHHNSAFLFDLARPIASIVDRRLVQRYGDIWPAHLADSSGQGTSGMYTVQSGDIHIDMSNDEITAKSLTLTRSRSWAFAQPHLREIQVNFVTMGTTRQEYLTSHANLVPAIEPGLFPQALHDPGYHEAPMPSIDYLALNWHKPPFDDLRVRQAFALALDKTQLAPLVPWSATQPTNHLVPEGVTGYNPSLTDPLGVTNPTGDPAQAKALWLSYVTDTCGGDANKCPEAQLSGGGCHTPDIPDNMAQLMLTNWRQAMPGLQVNFTSTRYPSCVLFANQPPLPPCLFTQLVRFSWDADPFQQRTWLAPLFDPSDPQYAFADPTGDTSYCTQDAPAITLLHAADSEPDAATRTRLYQSAEQQLVVDVAMIPLYQYRASWEVRPNVLHYPTTYRPWIDQSEWAAIYLAKP